MLTRIETTFAAAIAAIGMTTVGASAQNPITWTVKDIANAKTDVSTKGELCIAVNLGPEVCERVVNGVHFQADRSHWTKKILVRNGPVTNGVMYFPDFRSGGYVLKMPYNRTAPYGNTNGGIRHPNEAEYDHILKDVRHSQANTSPPPTFVVTCTIEGLTPGNTYEIQLFYGCARVPTRISEWDNGVGGREGNGGIFLRSSGTYGGQVATGTFVASNSGKQTFTNYQQPADPTANPPLKETHNAISAIQIRDLTARPLSARATYYGEGTPGTNTQPLLGGSKCSPAIALEGHPVRSTTVKLTVENSQDVASVAILVFGLSPVSVPVLGGTLLVAPTWPLALPMPQPVSPYVHDHELQLPLPLPPALITLYVQALELDPGAAGGFSFTPGIKIAIGL